ncbi:hypothetical protein [Salinibacter pepae]|uniref:hypothetical protein n=1 Tax=Salinibacter pepae TaxID=3040382 RepID=UPI0021E8F711|nr:hypothetical protein [Salinibacter pepae]
MTTDSSFGRWYSVPGLLALVLVCAGAVGMEAASPKASPLRSAEQTPLAPADTQHIALEEGWNLISSRLVPDAPSMEAVFAPIADAVKVVRGPSGTVYKPSDGTNTIGDWEVRAGYEVYVTSPQTLVIEGRLPVSNEADIPLEKGWNTVSYLPNTSQEPMEALASIEGALSMVKDETGDAFVPDEGINQLEQLAPGEGFKVHVSTSQTLSYPDPPLSSNLEYPTACLNAPKSVAVGEYGTLNPGASADSLNRVSNLEAVNAAIADAPAGGTVCLPSDSIYIAADQKWSDDFPDRDTRHHIEIRRDSITIMGAGACGWGDMGGCSYIGTPGSEESYMYLGPDPSGSDHTDVMRGSGMAIFPGLAQGSADSARAITLKGFELHGQAEHTGDYSWNLDEDSVDTYNGWDLTHKGFHLSANPSGNLTDLKIEDVHVYGYRGEVIYNGGFGLGTVTVRRVWSHESNGSAYNIATAKDQLVEDSKFGPRVRFWGELLAEGIPNATSVHRNNTYEGCNTGDGCIALALDDSQNLADGQTWTWTNNSFDHSGSTNPHFLLESGPYDLNITDNTFQGGKLWLANFGSGGERANLDVSGNEHDTEGTHPMKWQNGYYEGVITENTFLNSASPYRAAGSTDMQGLVITNNEFDGSKGISFGGNGADVYPLLEENTYTGNGPPSPRTLYSDETIRAYSEQYAVEEGLNGPYNVELEARASDGQRVWLFGGKGEIVLPADSSNHAWTSDFSLTSSSDSVQVEFDRPSKMWSIVE